jgi:outer membrane cobalamin receptor
MFLEQPPAVVDEVIVTAPRLPPGAGEAAFSVVRITPGDSVQVRLDEQLKQAPGVSLFRRTSSLAANATTQGLSLRAIAPSGAGRALVTLDGVPQNDPFGGWVIWSQLPSETIGLAVIVRGAGAGPYGAGALTGVVALEERETGGAFDGHLSELDSARASGAVTNQAGPFSLFAAVAVETSGGFTPVRGPRRGRADARADLAASALTLRASAQIGPAALAVRVNGYDEARGAGLAGARSRAAGTSASVTLARPPAPDSLGWRLQAWGRRSDLANSSVAVSFDRSVTTPANDQFETPATGQGFNAAARGRSGGLEWEGGVDFRRSEGEVRELFRFMGGAFTRERRAGGRTAVVGGYGEATWTSGPWLVTGGARADAWSNNEGRRLETDRSGALLLDERPPDRDGVVPTGRLGGRLKLGSDLSIRAAGYAGFRPATLNELHRPFRVGNDLTEANAALQPERLYGVEAGIGGSRGPTRWSATMFGNRLEDVVANVTVGVGPGVFSRAGFVPAGGVLRERRNAGLVRAAGLEAEAEHEFGERLSLRAAVSVVDARVDGGAEAPQLTGKRPAQAPIRTATGGAIWRPLSGWTARADLRWESGRFEDDLNSRWLAPALQVDGAVERRLASGLAIYLAAENLFAALIETGETADGVEQFGTPRVVRAGLRFVYGR